MREYKINNMDASIETYCRNSDFVRKSKFRKSKLSMIQVAKFATKLLQFNLRLFYI